MIIKILDYKPYNDFWFETCFYHGLAQIAGNLGIIDSLLLDGIFSYEYIIENDLPILKIKKEYLKGWKQCFNDKNIYTSFIQVAPDELVKKIKTSISMECPVMIPIDCFYESLRIDCYMKLHHLHNLVIIGYDDKRDIFKVLDHSYINDLYYKQQEVNYLEIEESYKGFMVNYNNGNIPEYIEINPKSFIQNTFENEISLNNIVIILETFINSFNKFDIFINEFENVFTIKNISSSIMDWYEKEFNALLKIKRVQFVQIKIIKFHYNLPENDLYLKTINNWNIIQGLTYKMTCIKKFPEHIMIRIISLLKQVNKDEKVIFESIKSNILERCL